MAAHATASAAAARKDATAQLRERVVTAWATHGVNVDGAVRLHPSKLADVLRDLDYGRRDMTLGRLAKTSISVAATPSDAAFVLRTLGITDVELKNKDTVVPQEAFTQLYIRETLGEPGHTRNKLLVKPVTGAVRSATHALPPAEFTYGRGSGQNEVPLSALLAFKFAGPDVARGKPKSHLKPDAVYGSRSGKTEDMSDLLCHKHGHPVEDEEKKLSEPAYADLSGKRGLGAFPATKHTTTSMLRSAHATKVLAAMGEAPKQEELEEAAGATAPKWKLPEFRDVPARVPVDGQPLRVSYRVLARAE